MQYYTVILTPRAERHLAHSYGYIADESSDARAEKFVSGIVVDCMSRTTFPERGNKRDDVRPHLRTKGYRRRVTIAFSVNMTTLIVAIHGVFYGGQDVEQWLCDSDSDD